MSGIKTAGNPIKEEVTSADTIRYSTMIDNGNIRGVYRELADKGFDTAVWSMAEFDKSTAYGVANSRYWENQTQKTLNRATIEALQSRIAKNTVAALNARIQKEGTVKYDLTYDEYTDARHKANRYYQHGNVKTIHDVPHEFYSHQYGKQQADSRFNEQMSLPEDTRYRFDTDAFRDAMRDAREKYPSAFNDPIANNVINGALKGIVNHPEWLLQADMPIFSGHNEQMRNVVNSERDFIAELTGNQDMLSMHEKFKNYYNDPDWAAKHGIPPSQAKHFADVIANRIIEENKRIADNGLSQNQINDGRQYQEHFESSFSPGLKSLTIALKEKPWVQWRTLVAPC